MHGTTIRLSLLSGLGSVMLGLFVLFSPSLVAQETHLFILSGQSNMAGMDQAPFTAHISALLPGKDIVVAKSAKGGQPIRKWLDTWDEIAKQTDVETPKGGKKKGDLYNPLLTAIRQQLGDRKPTTVTLCWMQGERDAKEKLSKAYATAFKALITRLSSDLDGADIRVVIGRLSDHGVGRPEWDAMRDIQVGLAKEIKGAWVDTDDLNDIDGKNDLHYSKSGYEVFAQRLAAQAYALLQDQEPAPDGRPSIN